jgi:site-specific recombinase XerC
MGKGRRERPFFCGANFARSIYRNYLLLRRQQASHSTAVLAGLGPKIEGRRRGATATGQVLASRFSKLALKAAFLAFYAAEYHCREPPI